MAKLKFNGVVTEVYTTPEKEKVNAIPDNPKYTDTVYTHPATHPSTMITGLPTSLPANGGNADTVGGFTVGVNVPANAKFTDTVYTHPVNHPPSIISQDANNRFVTDAEKSSWNGKADATIASASANGLMSSDMFTKLNGLYNMVYLTESAFQALGTKDPNTLYLRY